MTAPDHADAARRPRFGDPPAVAVIAAHDIARRRVATILLSGGFTVDAEVATADDFLARDMNPTPAALVLVCSTSITARAVAIRKLHRRLPQLSVVIVAPAGSRNGVRRALEAGADGFVLDSEIAAALAPTVRAIIAGQVAVPSQLRYQVDRPTFSHREKQTLAMLVMGLTNSEIASRLYLAESTVKCHLSSAFAKLGVRSRHEAVRIILDPEERVGLGILDRFEDPRNGRPIEAVPT